MITKSGVCALTTCVHGLSRGWVLAHLGTFTHVKLRIFSKTRITCAYYLIYRPLPHALNGLIHPDKRDMYILTWPSLTCMVINERAFKQPIQGIMQTWKQLCACFCMYSRAKQRSYMHTHHLAQAPAPVFTSPYSNHFSYMVPMPAQCRHPTRRWFSGT